MISCKTIHGGSATRLYFYNFFVYFFPYMYFVYQASTIARSSFSSLPVSFCLLLSASSGSELENSFTASPSSLLLQQAMHSVIKQPINPTPAPLRLLFALRLFVRDFVSPNPIAFEFSWFWPSAYFRSLVLSLGALSTEWC